MLESTSCMSTAITHTHVLAQTKSWCIDFQSNEADGMMSNDGRATDSVRIISTFPARTMFALPFNCNIISSNHLSISYFALTLAHTVHVRTCDESVEKMLKLSRHCYLGTEKKEEESNLSPSRRKRSKINIGFVNMLLSFSPCGRLASLSELRHEI